MERRPCQERDRRVRATVEDFSVGAKTWLETATDPRWHRRYTDLVYQPMLEVLRYLRPNGYKTYIVTGGGQDFVRVYADQVYGIPPEQVVGQSLYDEAKRSNWIVVSMKRDWRRIFAFDH
jgi:phosphoglycolate phosphatase-like HAD superfamily hydrolase